MRIASAILFASLLTGCASRPPPQISYDSDDFAPATVAEEPPRPVEIVEHALILPLRGQLKPVPADPNRVKGLGDPVEDVEAGNAAARVEPDGQAYINAIQVYPYNEGALYQVYAAPEQVTDIALQRGEALVSVSAGDTLRWVLGDTTSGSGTDERVHILVKPFEAGLMTNMLVTTDRRTYHVELQSLDETYMASVSWHYPQDRLIALQAQNQQAIAKEAEEIDQGLDLARLRFRYAISGDDPPWRPVRAFDDGSKVYIQFPRGLPQGEAPPLFVVGPEGEAQLVNYRVRGNYYIVDRLFAAAELRLGKDPQQIVRISRTDGVGDGS